MAGRTILRPAFYRNAVVCNCRASIFYINPVILKRILIQQILTFVSVVLTGYAVGQQSMTVSINEAWEFTKDSCVPGTSNHNQQWKPIHLPHCWNTTDVMDDEPGYYRGNAWYRKTLTVFSSQKGRQVFLRFEGVNQSAAVYVNGKLAGRHMGGYTAFQVAIHPFLRFTDTTAINEILVKVDNKSDQQIPPLSADFTFFGGIYRDVWMLSFGDIHFSMADHGSRAVFISTPRVTRENADVHIRGSIRNSRMGNSRIKVVSNIVDARGKSIAQATKALSLAAETETYFEQDIKDIRKPQLWSPDQPVLYSIKTQLVDIQSGAILDELIHPLAFRWFRFDAEKGFYLNGQPFKLIGASRHQDRPGHGNAVSDAQARNDIEWLKKMGGNFLRVAHYPQDPAVLEACDRLGILASVEIPVVNEITESDSFYRACMNMQTEMIRQNYNHPSVIIWCYMNEVLLRPHFNDDKEKQKKYFSNVTTLARKLDSLTRTEDPFRYTMMAHHGDFDKYHNNGLTQIPMIVGWNLYSGWYGGELQNFAAFLDKHRRLLPGKPMVVAEYGADADPRIRSLTPARFDKSVEYANRFHQYYISEMMKRPHVAAAMIWNLADFNSETREESMPHINNKGLLTWSRQPKETFYIYQAMLTNKPFLKIISESWKQRITSVDSNGRVSSQPLQVATNLDSVELMVNGRSHGWKKPIMGLCEWQAILMETENRIEVIGHAKGIVHSDITNIDCHIQPYDLRTATDFRQMNILLGAKRYFIDEEDGLLWQPDQLFHQGSWGHLDGRPFKAANNGRLPYGTDKDIRGTEKDPIYQTQQTGLTQYRLDVPPGQYELSFHFAELEGVPGKPIPYNLSSPSATIPHSPRIFSMYVNGELLLENFDMAGQYGLATAIMKKTVVTASDSGIKISFIPLSGEPVLNALQIRKIL